MLMESLLRDAGVLGGSVGVFANKGDNHTINFLTFITS